MKYYVWYSVYASEGFHLDSFSTEDEVLNFLNRYAANSEFKFTVIKGIEIEYKAVKLITVYERAK